MISIVQFTYCCFMFHLTVVVRHAVGFLIAAYFAHIFVWNLHTSEHVTYKDLAPDRRYEFNASAIVYSCYSGAERGYGTLLTTVCIFSL